MKTTVNMYDFEQAFMAIRPDNFSYDGLKALFEWFEDYEEGTGEQYELDVIAVCCEWSEYADLDEFQRNYGKDYESIEDIEEMTTVIQIDGFNGFITQDF